MAVHSDSHFNDESSRRDFLKSTSAWGFAALKAGPPISDNSCVAGVQKKETPEYPKLCMSAYSFHRYMQQSWPTSRHSKTPGLMTIHACARYCG